MILIRESKRDELIIPYMQALEEKGIHKTFKEFKSEMLDKLANQAAMRNLSKGSNFYLAGAVRYYFAGQLTTDGRASYAENGNVLEPDNWNVEACKQLNALINVLRNSYIDSIGTTFEQPEDFGTLTLPKLLKKYGKKIKTEMGTEENPEEVDTLDRNNRVGNGYTFDILYSYNDATKYNQATSPGAWCITYGQGHFDNYVRRLDIHYVIFLKDGYENVPRQVGPGYTRRQPHDEYGNSMIAVLQSNKNWKPIYITSRWNHGYGETSGTEADHAYTLEEFCNITGVTPEDLKRIWEIWNTDSENNAKKEFHDKSADRDALRKLKYAQMKINGGENIVTAIESVGGKLIGALIGDREYPNKSVMEGVIDNAYKFIVDKGKIVFEMFTYQIDYLDHGFFRDYENTGFKDCIVAECGTYYMIYNARYHEVVRIGDKTKFKRLPQFDLQGAKFIEVKNGMKDIALLSTANVRPLKLPNGDFWFNAIYYAGNNTRYERGGQIIAHPIPHQSTILDIVYDESSGEEYFYNNATNKFIELPNIVNNEMPMGGENFNRDNEQPQDFRPKIDFDFAVDNYYAVTFCPSRERSSYWGYKTRDMIFNAEGKRIFIYGKGKFIGPKNVDLYDSQVISIGYKRGNEEIYYCPDNASWYYDLVHKKMLGIGWHMFFTEGYRDESNPCRNIITFKNPMGIGDNSYNGPVALYDKKEGKFLKNPYGYPNEFSFRGFSISNEGIVEFEKDHFDIYDQMNGNYSNELWKKLQALKEKEHTARIPLSSLEYLENDMPVNNEDYGDESKDSQDIPLIGQRLRFTPSAALTENEIRDIVEETIRRLIG